MPTNLKFLRFWVLNMTFSKCFVWAVAWCLHADSWWGEGIGCPWSSDSCLPLLTGCLTKPHGLTLLHFLASNFCRMLIPLQLFYSKLKSTLVTLQVQNFGEPFFLVVHQTETLAEVKQRIQTKLAIPDEEFSKVCSWSFLVKDLPIPFHVLIKYYPYDSLFY